MTTLTQDFDRLELAIQSYKDGLKGVIAEESKSLFFDSSPTPMAILDGSGKIITTNDAFDSVWPETKQSILSNVIGCPFIQRVIQTIQLNKVYSFVSAKPKYTWSAVKRSISGEEMIFCTAYNQK